MNIHMANGRYVLRVAGYRHSLNILLLHQVNNQSHRVDYGLPAHNLGILVICCPSKNKAEKLDGMF